VAVTRAGQQTTGLSGCRANIGHDEHWHGQAIAEQVTWLLAERAVGEYRVTEMEDAGTAFALARFGLRRRCLDRCVPIDRTTACSHR